MGRKIFVGNIPYMLRQEEFVKHWEGYSNFERAYLIFNREKQGQNKGFGFVIFSDSESARAVANETHEFHGQTLDCRIHDTKAEQYFVQNLGNITEQQLREYFENLGEVDKIIMKPEKKIAFVTVKLSDDGCDLFTMDHSALSADVVIKKARQQSDRGRGRGGFGRGRGRGFRGGPFGGYRGGFGGGPYGGGPPPYGGGWQDNWQPRDRGGWRPRGGWRGRGFQHRGGYHQGPYNGGYNSRGGFSKVGGYQRHHPY